MKLLITGTTGFVGHKIMESYAQAATAPSLRNATQEMIKRMVEESEACEPVSFIMEYRCFWKVVFAMQQFVSLMPHSRM